MSDFQLHPRLAADTLPVIRTPLSSFLLMNDRRFPWLIVVPGKAGAVELFDLSFEEQKLLLQEISLAAHALRTLFKPDRFNVAALGNVTPQLHVHVVARFCGDAAWPRPVWGVGQAEAYDQTEAADLAANCAGLIEKERQSLCIQYL
jgi:diadenosine tetraphosphate (Ap4A) HIT family hydrolase